MNAIVRTAVVALALTGSVSYAHILSSPTKTVVLTSHPGASFPMCEPSEPTGCGMAR